jgi:anti-sigma regulatory factor (Ser/Thr protein kinase)
MDHQRVEIDLAAEVVAPRFARRSIEGWLESQGCTAQPISDVGLVVGELVMNAVVHARTPATLVAQRELGYVRIEVRDDSADRPTQRLVGTAQGGFGLTIVERLSESWGWGYQPAGGKVVWALVRC